MDVATRVPFEGVFAPLRDPAFFRQVRVDPELHTVCWPNGADLDPEVLYSAVTGTPLTAWADDVLDGGPWPDAPVAT